MNHIGLSLSGGGFRATLFHLGVIRALRDCGRLQSVKYITSVSGGSIVAAHLVLNWKDYTSKDPDTFKRISKTVIDYVQHDVRNRIMHLYPYAAILRGAVSAYQRLPWPIVTSRTHDWSERAIDFLSATGLLARHCRKLLGDTSIAALDSSGDDHEVSPPKLYILGTNITTASLCSFSKDGFEDIHDGTGSALPRDPIGPELIAVAEAVAASSAFPGFFPPIRFTRQRLCWDQKEFPPEYQFVADAGIYDNLGVSKFFEMEDNGALQKGELDYVLVSDASGEVDWDTNRRMGHVFGSGVRTVDIIISRNRDLQKKAAQERKGIRYEFIELATDDLESPSVTKGRQKLLRFIRTDFDSFNDTLVQHLIHHGYKAAQNRLSNSVHGDKLTFAPPFESWYREWPVCSDEHDAPRDEAHKTRLLRRSRSRKVLRLRPMNYVLWWIHWIVLLPLIAIALIYSPGYYLDKAKRQQIDRQVGALMSTDPIQLFDSRNLVRHRDRLEKPAYLPFEFLEDNRILDLREWTLVPEGVLLSDLDAITPRDQGEGDAQGHEAPQRQGESSGPLDRREQLRLQSSVTMLRSIRLKKIAEAKEIKFEFGTSGLDVFLHCQGIGNYEVLESTKKRRVGSLEMKIRQIKVIIKDIPVGKEFTIHLQATYWNAYQREDQWFSGLLSYGKLDQWSILLLFPGDRPLKKYSLRDVKQTDVKQTDVEQTDVEQTDVEQTDIEAEDVPYRGRGFLYTPNNSFIYWEVPRPKLLRVYKLTWRW